MFVPWTSDIGPKVPQGWGLATYRNRADLPPCDGCGEFLEFRDEYLYRFTPEGTEILHNRKACYEGLIV